jgi:hypothetical protein
MLGTIDRFEFSDNTTGTDSTGYIRGMWAMRRSGNYKQSRVPSSLMSESTHRDEEICSMRNHPRMTNVGTLGNCVWLLRAARVTCLAVGIALLVDVIWARDTPKETGSITQDSPVHLHVEIVDDVVTVSAHNVAVENLLAEIARQTGLVVVSHDVLDQRVSIQLDRIHLPEAVHRILRGQDFILHYIHPGTRRTNAVRPGTLWVFAKETAGRQYTNRSVFDDNPTMVAPQIEALLSADVRGRITAVRNSTALEAAEAVAQLGLALSDRDRRVRAEAVSVLADIGGDQATALLPVALGDEDPWVRQEAVHALAEIGGKQAIRVLEGAFAGADRNVREAAVDALADIGGDAATRALAVVLLEHDDSLRAQAVHALGEIGGETAMTQLQQALVDQDPSIREIAAEILANLVRQNQRSQK